MPALAMLQACATEPVVAYRDREVLTPVPVRAPIDPRLTADCEPRSDLPMAGALTAKDALARLAAVEDALDMCRLQLEALRNLDK